MGYKFDKKWTCCKPLIRYFEGQIQEIKQYPVMRTMTNENWIISAFLLAIKSIAATNQSRNINNLPEYWKHNRSVNLKLEHHNPPKLYNRCISPQMRKNSFGHLPNTMDVSIPCFYVDRHCLDVFLWSLVSCLWFTLVESSRSEPSRVATKNLWRFWGRAADTGSIIL